MKVIKLGQLPEEEPFRGTCGQCGTVFECTRAEGKYHYGAQRDGPFLTVTCPLCNREAFAYKQNGGALVPRYSLRDAPANLR